MLVEFKTKSTDPERSHGSFSSEDLREILHIPGTRRAGFVEALPFSAEDITAGSENELQVAVRGGNQDVDLPLVIQESNYFSNIMRRVASGDTSDRAMTNLAKFLEDNPEGVWDNSWVRFPKARLNRFAVEILDQDLLRDKKNPQSGLREDVGKFFTHHKGEECVRIPVSYLLKLSLAHILGSQSGMSPLIESVGRKVMGHFLSDNTSPETHSFYVIPLSPSTGFGRAAAKEMSKRFLLTQMLVMYANRAFGLVESGQEALIYFSPHPPTRQKDLNECISDSFYREIFMSPCLSGWDNGEEKHAYMCLCHQVLSRSQLNAVAKLREAGIITRNLVVLPNVSNISLANNGTHVSLGSRKLTRLRADPESGFTGATEKYLGDLVIKMVEHFVPLFVGTYSAAPYRLDFGDFHPERALGFLPHELDYTHLRMLWRRWKKKAGLKILGTSITPFGLGRLDRALSAVFRMRGDLVPDFRLIDYPVSLMSTDRSPALDGSPGNEGRLKKDLTDLGVFDSGMPLYLLYRLREYSKVGFSGFEGRQYSVFHSIMSDMTHAGNLQVLINALAFKYALEGKWTHAKIPDNPLIESERRQICFGAAIGIPTFYVREDTENLFLKSIVALTRHVRYSRRYRGYVRLYVRQYCLALLEVLRRDGADLIEAFGFRETVEDAHARLLEPEKYGVAGRLTSAISDQLGAHSPRKVRARDFNLASERYYRTVLRRENIDEAFEALSNDFKEIRKSWWEIDEASRESLGICFPDEDPTGFLEKMREGVRNGHAAPADTAKVVKLLLIGIHVDSQRANERLNSERNHDFDSTPLCGSGNRNNP